MSRSLRHRPSSASLVLPASRRGLLRAGLLGGGAALLGLGTSSLFPKPAIATSAAAAPVLTHGVQSGDVGYDGGVVWARADRPARMIVDYASTDSFKDIRRQIGPAALQDTDFTARLALGDLPAGQDVFYKVSFQDLGDLQSISEPVTGHFRTAPAARREINFIWSGDVVGQVDAEGIGAQVFRGHTADGRRHVEERGLDAGRGDDDLADLPGIRGIAGERRERQCRGGQEEERGAIELHRGRSSRFSGGTIVPDRGF